MATKSYLATAFIGEKEVSGAFGSGEFRSSLNFARRELRGYQRLAETIYRHEVVFCNRRGLEDIVAPELEFGILTETKDSETGIVEANFSVTSTYTAEDFVSDTRDAFLAFAAEDFGEQIASEAVTLVDGQTTSMLWHNASRYGTASRVTTYTAFRLQINSLMGSVSSQLPLLMGAQLT